MMRYGTDVTTLKDHDGNALTDRRSVEDVDKTFYIDLFKLRATTEPLLLGSEGEKVPFIQISEVESLQADEQRKSTCQG